MLLDAKDLSKSYYSDRGILVCRALDGVSLALEEGERIAVTGPSGSGKSTLLNILGAIDYPDGGTVEFRGTPLGGLDGKAQAEFRNRRVGFIFQDHYLVNHCSVLENVLLPCLAEKRRTTADERGRAEDLLERLGIADKRDSLPSMLSGGERQRAAFARSLVMSPDFVLADEPTGNLDSGNSDRAMELLLGYAEEEGKALVVVTHSPRVASMLPSGYALVDGRLEAAGRG